MSDAESRVARWTRRARANPAWLFAGILFVTFVAYWPALRAGFVWNDPDYVTAAHLRSVGGLWRIWFEVGATEQYYPVLHSAFWIQHLLWGDAAVGYHVLNVLLHVTSACLLVLALRRLQCPGAALVGFIYAVHPVCVESAAWISEEKNTLSLVFYLAAAVSYLRFDADRGRRDYAIASVFFGLALLTKSVTATLPAALLLVLWWRRGELRWSQDIRPLVSWLVAGVAFGLFSAWVERHYIGAQGSDFNLGPVERLVLAGRIIWFYVGKTYWPADLIFIYPRWQINAAELWQWLYLIAALAVTLALWLIRRRTRGPLTGWLFFLGSLFPTLGFFNVYAFKFSFVADHWQYLPCIGLIALAVGGIVRALESPGKLPRGTAQAGVAAMMIGLPVKTWRQCRPYHDLGTFYRAILARNPSAWLAHNNLGLEFVTMGRPAQALPHFEEVLRLRPNHDEAEANLGGALVKLGRYNEAAPHLQAALRSEELRPRESYAELQANWAAVLLQQNRLPEAEAMLEAAIRTKPGLAEAYDLLGLVRVRRQKPDEAQRAYEEALRIRPDFASAHLNLAALFAQRGEWLEATRHYAEGVRLAPAPVEAHRDFALALLRTRRAADAVTVLDNVVRARPDDGLSRANLAVALAEAGRMPEAVAQAEEAAKRSPENAVVLRTRDQLRALSTQANARP